MKTECLNCGEALDDIFCGHCGQKNRDNDRSIRHLVGDLFNNMFFIDSRFWLSYRYLLVKPGLMSFEFLEGKRKKFIPPVTIFLFINVLYFFFSPLSDYSLSLSDQMYQPFYGDLATEMVEVKLAEEGLEFDAYSKQYRRSTNNISKTIMILNVPMIAFLVYLITLRKRKFYFDSLIYSLHFFSAFLLIVITGFMTRPIYLAVMGLLGLNISLWTFWYPTFMLVLPLVYAVISYRNFSQKKWVHAIWGGCYVLLSVAIAQFVYRVIIFFVTFWMN